jgi:hypothetical protein
LTEEEHGHDGDARESMMKKEDRAEDAQLQHVPQKVRDAGFRVSQKANFNGLGSEIS